MLWSSFLGYIILSEIVVVAAMVLGLTAKDCPPVEHFDRLDSRQKWIAMLVTGTLAILLAPVVAPLLIFCLIKVFQTADADSRYWNEVRSTHQELILELVHPSNISDELAAHFQLHSPSLDGLGYEPLGTYWLKHEPFNSKARFYRDPQGISIAEIGLTLDVCYCEIQSFLEDGSIISTASCDPFDAAKFAKKGFHVQFCPNQEMIDLIEAHQTFVQRIANEEKSPVRLVMNDDWMEYCRYQGRRFSQIKYEIGEGKEPVDCEFPPARVSDSLASQPCIANATIPPANASAINE